MNVLTANIYRNARLKPEDDSVLVVHSNAAVTLKVASQLLKLVTRAFQIIKANCSVENIELTGHNLPNSLIDLSGCLRMSAVIDVLRGAISKGLDHGLIVHVYRVHVNHTYAYMQEAALGRDWARKT